MVSKENGYQIDYQVIFNSYQSQPDSGSAPISADSHSDIGSNGYVIEIDKTKMNRAAVISSHRSIPRFVFQSPI